jgi:tetratricopeptide (TPR) repeat protein
MNEVPNRKLLDRIIATTPKSFFESPYLSTTFRNTLIIGKESVKKVASTDKMDVEINKARDLNKQGDILGKQGKYKQAINCLDKVIVKFSNTNTESLIIEVVWAMYNKGRFLGQLNKTEEEIAVYDEICMRYAKENDSKLREVVTSVMVLKGAILCQLNRFEESIAVCDKVIEGFAETSEIMSLEQLAMVMILNGTSLVQLNHIEEAIAVYDEVMARFADISEVGIRKLVARAMICKVAALCQRDYFEESIDVCNKVVMCFANANETAIRKEVANAMVLQGTILSQLKRYEEAEAALKPDEIAIHPDKAPAHMAGAVLTINEQVERLVEVAVARRVDRLVRELVNDECRELGIAVAKHRVRHRVAQVPERRVGDGRADKDVKALCPHLAGFTRRARLVKVAPVTHAARDRKAPALGLDREFGSGEQVPCDVTPAEVGEGAVTAVVRQAQLAHGKVTRARGEVEPAAQRRIRVRTCDHLLDRLALAVHLHLPLGEVQVVAAGEHDAGGAGGEQPDRAQRGIA